MKNFFFLLLIVPALLLVSCNDKDDEIDEPQKILSASPGKLTFPYEGDALSFDITAKNVEWKITVSSDWITWKETGKKDGDNGTTVHTIEVKLGEGPAEGRSGKLTISAEGVTSVEVEVIQEDEDGEEIPDVFFWETNSLRRMNYYGNVKSTNLHIALTRDITMTDLEFNQKGWLTSFVHTVYGGDKIANTISYDDNDRIIRLVGNDDLGETADITFVYGNDSRYIHTEYLFYFMAYDANADLMAWCPQFMRGLEKITVKSGFGFTYDLVVDADAGTIIQYETGREYDPYVWDMKFDGDFPTEYMVDNWGDVKVSFELDTETGLLLKHETDDGWGLSEILYNTDRINSIASVRSDWDDLEYGYNDNLDVVTVSDYGNITELDYEYDHAGNWTKSTSNGNSTERTVLYWEIN